MRHKRAKVYKKAISIYTTAFGFRQPFQVLVSNDVLVALNRESDIHKQLSACVQGQVKPMITQCCMEALYKLGKEYQAVVDIAKSFERRRCNHRTAIEPDDCLKDVIGGSNKHRYVVAAQSKALRLDLSVIPGLPFIHFNPRGVLVLSPLSHATLKTKDVQEEERRLEGADLLKDLVHGENVVGAPATGSGIPKSHRSRVRQPNPLSMKKKKAQSGDRETEAKPAKEEKVEEAAKKRKKRKRPQKGVVKQAIDEINAEYRERAVDKADS